MIDVSGQLKIAMKLSKPMDLLSATWISEDIRLSFVRLTNEVRRAVDTRITRGWDTKI